jgi:hypothetical protein
MKSLEDCLWAAASDEAADASLSSKSSSNQLGLFRLSAVPGKLLESIAAFESSFCLADTFHGNDEEFELSSVIPSLSLTITTSGSTEDTEGTA